MRKIVKKFEEFVYGSETKPAPAPTITPTETPRPARPSVIPTERPSVQDDPLAVLKDKLEGSKLEGNILYYKDYKIEYPSETKSYVVNDNNLGKDYQSVIDYITKMESYYDAEYDALKGDNELKESKSYKHTRKFGK